MRVSHHLSKSKGLRLAIVILCLVFLVVAYYYFGEQLIGNAASGQLKSAFNQQSALLYHPIASLGVTGSPSPIFQCTDIKHTRLESYVLCEYFYDYPYNQDSISSAAKNSLIGNATRLDKLLRQNRWVNDRPNEPITTLAGSDPYSTQNGGIGGEVPFHKNIGPISCNLEINFEGLFFPENIAPGSINVNYFSCQQIIKVFMPHLGSWQSED